jgi:hypothetical protein
MSDKFEMVKCLREGRDCQEHRLVINRGFNESDIFLINKEYSMSILTLKDAYYKTTELQESSCAQCAELFRCTIRKSLEYIYDDLHRMTKGFFGTKRYQSSYELVCNVLEEIKAEN